MKSETGGGQMDGFYMMLCFVFMCVGFLTGSIIVGNLTESDWESKAVRHGAARYNEKTAAFEWIELEAPSETLKYSEVPDVR